MLQQERDATAGRRLQQTYWAAEGARNWAVCRLYEGPDPVERVIPNGTPYIDTVDEFDIPLDDARLGPLKVTDGRGLLWGVTAQDEQAKLNVAGA